MRFGFSKCGFIPCLSPDVLPIFNIAQHIIEPWVQAGVKGENVTRDLGLKVLGQLSAAAAG
ncbi:MAG: hypothetical protein JRD84_08705 [Deltaproteobacteria bacterium]|nr:hypothetical protein [Deltaproteobacteria bacterium]